MLGVHARRLHQTTPPPTTPAPAMAGAYSHSHAQSAAEYTRSVPLARVRLLARALGARGCSLLASQPASGRWGTIGYACVRAQSARTLVRVCAYGCVSMSVRSHVRVRACAYSCARAYVRASTQAHSRASARMSVRARTSVSARKFRRLRASARVCVGVRVQVRVYAWVYVCESACVRARVRGLMHVRPRVRAPLRILVRTDGCLFACGSLDV
jgi:hypothetical protein